MKQHGKPDRYVGRRFGEFAKLHKRLRTEMPGKILPPLPRKNKGSVSSTILGGGDDDASSVSSVSTQDANFTDDSRSARTLTVNNADHHRSSSRSSVTKKLKSATVTPRPSTGDLKTEVTVSLYRENQRVSLRAFLRTLLQNPRIAESKALEEFLTADPITLNEEELMDIQRRKDLDAKRVEEQRQFYEIARKRAQELDVYMEQFRQDIVENSKCLAWLFWLLWIVHTLQSSKDFLG